MAFGAATAVATVAVTGCSPPEQSVTEFLHNGFCNHVTGDQSTAALESFTADPNLDDAVEIRNQSVEYHRMAQLLAPPEIADAVARAAPGMIDLIDLIVSTGFDPSLADPAETDRVTRSVEDSLAATDEVQDWVDTNC